MNGDGNTVRAKEATQKQELANNRKPYSKYKEVNSESEIREDISQISAEEKMTMLQTKGESDHRPTPPKNNYYQYYAV